MIYQNTNGSDFASPLLAILKSMEGVRYEFEDRAS